MKKFLTSLATISLLASPIASTTALTNMHQKHNVTNNQKAANESAEQIAGKLRKHTIKLDPNVWLGRHTQNYENELNALVVKQGILSADEVKYVKWSDVNLTVAGWYWTVNFTVTVDGASVTDNACLDMDSGETPAQIVSKLEKYPIQLNYNYWNGKILIDYLPQLQSILVQEGILTQVEASVVTGLDDYAGFGFTVNSSWIGKPIPINWIVNDRNNVDDSYSNVQTNNDGDSAQQLASTITSGDNYHISKNDVGDYAYSNGPKADITQQLLTYTFANYQIHYVQMPRIILQPVNNVRFNVKKDGQNALSVPCTITCDQ